MCVAVRKTRRNQHREYFLLKTEKVCGIEHKKPARKKEEKKLSVDEGIQCHWRIVAITR